ncbi:hypothetical protein DYBT9275_04103 [Dyadobacter sp. CECT 9275]|uniref:Glycosyltransferase RgtA/B/C/D-like domain-containing protein n=1 Tax=Dyadobacter helix TaxID=2822344 RepID=A0A916JDU4_9BACT|nr:glycosyltransferase family 39 protein [Dyadobacter sp. CECT 9275]CAG5007683.1 hypothetical protein DYBT9275_04103 [Dyadobacter sp. CECT 9275]
MILLIPLAFWLSTINLYYSFEIKSLRKSVLAAITFLFFFIGTSTEVLSFSGLISSRGIAVAWALLNAGLLAWFLTLRRIGSVNFALFLSAALRAARQFFKTLGIYPSLILSTLMGATLVVALVAPPNNLDSLSYHLSRLGYWIQNGNVEHYASHIERSISFSPFSEYVHLHTFLLSDSERYFQILQWVCLAGILVQVSLLVELFSKSRRALGLALCYAATIPIVILESMTTQNDLVVSFFIVSTAHYVFAYVRQSDNKMLVWLVLAIALGIQTKGTFVFYVLPFGIYLFVMMVRNKSWLTLLRFGTGVVMVTLLLNLPFWYRTHQVYGSPLGTVSNGNKNHTDSPQKFISSTSKHIFLHLGFISPQNKYNNWLEGNLVSFHHWLGIPMQDTGAQSFKMNKLNFNEDFAQNFLAMWLILFSGLLLPFIRKSWNFLLYYALVILGFLVFCFFIGYQHYGSRLHMPFFLLAAPAIGLIYGSSVILIQRILLTVLWLQAMPFALLSVTHPLLSTKWFFEEVFPSVNKSLHLSINTDNIYNLKQESILFASAGEIMWRDEWAQMQSLTRFIDSIHARNIGFDFTEASYDYAFQYSLRRPGRHFEHVLVENPSRSLEKQSFIPDCIISEKTKQPYLTCRGNAYHLGWLEGNRAVYVRVKPL